ncbi:membrane protein [Sphingomonas sp. BE138]|uniref:HAD family hydrolase n=1 Tax=Sphingomonas sp. BE138 TaxID=2817845 RepID=UPI00285625E2|nr:HAD family hydrolase [Sphingomonas sp. BE138]MDR6790287.1 membrane protein [Sphingomonas sp. BE138]
MSYLVVPITVRRALQRQLGSDDTMAIKAVLFDIDGTLVDSNDYHVEAWQTVFNRIGATFDDRAVHDQIGKGTDMLVPTLLPDADEAEEERMGEEHGRIFKSKYLEKVTPFAAARDLLVKVKDSGRQVVLASSASSEELEYYVRLLDAGEIVGVSTTSDDVERTKPAPDIFATALEKLSSLEASEVIVVGDTPYDIEAAARCGIAAVGVRSGKFNDQALRGAGAVALYDDVAALLADFEASPLNG